MSGIPALGSLAQRGFLGTLRSWLGTWSGETRSSPADLPSETRMPHAHSSVRVLVADDNLVNLMVLSALLESRGLVTLLAADGAEALGCSTRSAFRSVATCRRGGRLMR
jgi:hypothetical protein